LSSSSEGVEGRETFRSLNNWTSTQDMEQQSVYKVTSETDKLTTSPHSDTHV